MFLTAIFKRNARDFCCRYPKHTAGCSHFWAHRLLQEEKSKNKQKDEIEKNENKLIACPGFNRSVTVFHTCCCSLFKFYLKTRNNFDEGSSLQEKSCISSVRGTIVSRPGPWWPSCKPLISCFAIFVADLRAQLVVSVRSRMMTYDNN